MRLNRKLIFDIITIVKGVGSMKALITGASSEVGKINYSILKEFKI